MYKKSILPILIVILFSGFWLSRYFHSFFSPTDVVAAEKAYSTSQYVLGDLSLEKIDDATVYTYAAYRYAQGEDPTKINFEHPPFGKYVLGFSWSVFGNMTIVNFLLYVFCLILFWYLTKLVIKGYYFRILALAFLCTISLLPYYVFQSMLDIQLLFFTLAFFSSLFLVKNQKLSTILSGVSLGAFSSVKYYFPVIFLFLIILFCVALSRKKIKFFIATIAVAVIFYLLTYLRYFFINPNPIDFLKFEWYRFRWWVGDRSMPRFLILETIFFGKFKGWWGENVYEISPNWSIIWPVTLLGWIVNLFSIKKNLAIISLTLFPFLLFLMYLFGAAANERYLIQLIPFWIMGLICFLEKCYFKFINYRKH